MPIYDVSCLACGYENSETVSFAELEAWDLQAVCPSCHADGGRFCRVIKHAPSVHGAAGGVTRFDAARRGTSGRPAMSSTAKDEMMHKASKSVDKDKIAAARESVKNGEFEGF